ncbi:PLP-dependent aminotransferase family protein [Nocardia sp. NPDC058705]|uniref:MocR-like pyridoxine biosynthesis transcription factor PdxR n=1 Tax=Nocardia sp. NPDC058705 TaxID=3346609 RepID=UPI0036C5D9E9
MLDDLPIPLDRTAPEPLSVQVADALRAAATDRVLRVGDRLPSSRALAQRLGVSRTVVAGAYDQLHAEGWLTGKHGSGTYLSTAPAAAPTTTDAHHDTDPDANLLDLSPGAPCAEAVDSAAWRRAWRAAGDQAPETRKNRAGEPDFRTAVADHLLRHRGLAAGPGSVVLATAGASSAVAELAAALLAPGDTVAIEDPGYLRAVGAFRAAGIEVLPVPVDAGGLCVDRIPAGVRAVYCTPAHQFPLGAMMPASRRVELIEFARTTGAFVIEDDYDGELRYDTAPLPLLASMAPDVVVHLGTTSKIIATTLGVGWLVARPDITDAVLTHRTHIGSSPSPAGQHVLSEFARHGDLSRHLRRLRRVVPPRRALVVDELARHGLPVTGDDAGSHVVVELPDAAAEHHAVTTARTRGVLLDGLARHHLAEPDHHFGVAIGYTALNSTDLARAMPIAASCLAQASRR